MMPLCVLFFFNFGFVYFVINETNHDLDGSFNMVATDDEASTKETDPRAYELASSFKNMCNVKMPEVSLV